uniref:Uncharacterized protein n=1 Tax=Florenciella parvula TaxID=236787 RepID=A0A7S2C3L1_9STRA|mmetsp:Transcript_24064/g.49777  ORF Transcript_24064/g.49777 Transcript_24064/m.49777 type:complete len:155 (+) Transcript_24064:126-590(+)
MGIGKMKQKQKSNKKAKAKRRAQQNTTAMAVEDVPDAQDAAAVEADGEKPLTGRQKHQMKVDAKRRVREMLAYKQNERVRFAKKSTDAEPRAMRKALCAEIAMLKQNIPQAMHRSKVAEEDKVSANTKSAPVKYVERPSRTGAAAAEDEMIEEY